MFTSGPATVPGRSPDPRDAPVNTAEYLARVGYEWLIEARGSPARNTTPERAMATKIAVSEWVSVNLSQYHAGQICTPWLEERVVRGGSPEALILEVRWGWIDASCARGEEGREYGEGSCRGKVDTCRRAVQAAGIRTDDSHSWM